MGQDVQDILIFEDGTIGIPETSLSNHLTPWNNPEDGRIQFNRGGSLRSRKKYLINFS
jgi:hypothetical protein